MIKLNLETKTREHELIKEYLENNVSETLATKINEGVQIVKDTKILINKKDLTGFMNYASNEAKKLAEKGTNYACIEHATVFGWAIHYFEESSIEGTLYNQDGTKYQPVIKKIEPPKVEVKKEPEKPKNSQTSFFDFNIQEDIVIGNNEDKPKEISQEIEYEEPDELFDEDTTDKVPYKRLDENTFVDTKTGEVITETAQTNDFEEEPIKILKSLLGSKLEVKL